MAPYPLRLALVLILGSPAAIGAQEALVDGKGIPSPDRSMVRNPLSGVMLSDMTSFLERPLFNPGRRKPGAVLRVPEIVAPPAAAPAADHLRLIGTLSADAAASAVIENTRSKTTVSVSNGQLVDGWTVVDITTSTARIERNGIEVTLEMFRARNASTVGPPSSSVGEATSSTADAPVPTGQSAMQARSNASTTVQGRSNPSASSTAAPAAIARGTAAASPAAQSDYKLVFGAPPSPDAK